jgi:hypothetical protein
LTNGPQGLQKSGLPLRFQSQFGNSVRKYARRVQLALLVQTFLNHLWWQGGDEIFLFQHHSFAAIVGYVTVAC